MPARRAVKAAKPSTEFDLEDFLDSAGLARTIVKYPRLGVVYSQGDPAAQVMYIQQGSVTISVLSTTGKEANIAMRRAGHCFGVGSLRGSSRPIATEVATC